MATGSEGLHRHQAQLVGAARWVTRLRLDDVPADVIELARAQQVNMIAAIFAGARSGPGQRATRAIDRLGTEGPVRTIPDGRPRSLLDAVWLHAAWSNALELDDFVFAGHTGQASVGVPLALGQITGATGDQALLAQIAANEVAGRLGATMTVGPQQGHMKSYLYRAAAATAAAKLLGLDDDQTARALATALSGPEYPLFPASFSADTKVASTASPVVEGVRAAYLAAEGFDAALDVVEHPVGLVTSLSHHGHCPPVWDRLGQTWSTQAICFKPLAACAYAAAATSAIADIGEELGGGDLSERVRRVDVETNVLSLTMEAFSRPHAGIPTPVNTNFSTRRSVALALIGGAPRGSHFTEEAFAELAPRIGQVAEKVQLSHHWPHTLTMLRGVDAAIDHPGRPGVYGMSEAHSVMARFNEAFGTPKAVTPSDVPAIAGLGWTDASYVARRYVAGLRSKLPFPGGEEARRAYVSRETDLRQMKLAFASSVRVTLDDGRTVERTIEVAPGFAGDPNRTDRPALKLRLEVSEGASEADADALLELLTRDEPAAPEPIAAAFTGMKP